MIRDIIDKNENVNVSTYEMRKLREVIPQCFNEDNTFDMEKFQFLLKGKINIKNEGYGLHFLGKSYARMLASLDTKTVITPDEEHNAKDENKNSENIYITGDNLDALKHLLKSYIRKVKCIYIDPPYNTGKDDFVYKDNFNFTVDELTERLSINEDEAQRILDLTKRGSASHSAWLTFMYPRLLLARDLLTDDGVIFISIDDNEQANLKLLCDEIFGEENFISQLIWEKVHTRKNSAINFSVSHDYIICYAKLNRILDDVKGFKRNLLPREDIKAYSNPDNDPNGPWKPDPIYANNPYNADYTIKKPNGVVLKRPNGKYWRYSEETINKAIKENKIIWGNNSSYPSIKRYLSEVADGLVPTTLFDRKFAGDNMKGTEEVNELFSSDKIFSYPKPTKLIERLIQIGSNSKDIVLDFFSGSATTAHAVMDLNAKDSGNRKYIMVQLAEKIAENKPAYKAGYRTIDEIGRERIIRAAKKIKEKNPGLKADLGFKHYVLNEVNDDIFDTLEQFKLEETLISDNHVLNLFGAKTVLTTWLIYDGYGFCADVNITKLGNYMAYYCQKHLYFIYDNFDDDAMQALIEKYDGDGSFNPENIIVFGYSFSWTQMQMLKDNLQRLKVTDRNIDIRY